MRTPTLLAALAIAPAIFAQDFSALVIPAPPVFSAQIISAQFIPPYANATQLASAPATRTSTVFSTETGLPCSTLKGPTPFVIFGVTTSFQFTYTVTQNGTLPPSTFHSASTITVTRNSTTVTSLLTAMATTTVTSTVTPAVVTVLPVCRAHGMYLPFR